KRLFQYLLFLCALCAFAENFFAQDNVLTQKEVDFLPIQISLQRMIQSGSVEEKREALKQIRNLETAEASRLAVPALRDSSEIVRASAAFSVIFLPADEALNVLSPLLNDKKELVRREAAYALGKVRNPLAVNSLLQVFQKDKITDVRNAAIVALGEIGDASAIDALAGILRKSPKKDDQADEFLRRSAARSIGQIAQFIQTGKARVLTPQNFPPEQLKEIEKPNYPKLVEQFPVFQRAISVLIETLRNRNESDDAKREAAFALGAIGDAAAIPVLRANLNSQDYYLAEISKEALRKIELLSNSKNAE
ncbi:MAG TPA: HEAT repeat domain-containing protein, partial [Pyrinomonadaceae bacterium]